MKNKHLWIWALIIVFTSSAYASSFRILTIKSNQSQFSKQFFAGFSSSTPEKIIAFDYYGDNAKVLSKKIKEIAPDLVMTIGQLPIFGAVADFPSTPFLISNDNASELDNRNNVIMIHHDISIAQKLSMLKFLFPKMKSIGTIYDPAYSVKEYESFALAATSMGLKVLSIKVGSEKDIPSYMQGLKDKIDAYFYISDPTTQSDQSASTLYEFLATHNIPALSSNYEHCGQGALLTISPDPIRLGEKTWQTAREILQSGTIKNKSVHLADDEYVLAISLKGARQFEISAKDMMAFTMQATDRKWKVFWQQ